MMKVQMMITVCLALTVMACNNTKKSGENQDTAKTEAAAPVEQPTAVATTPLNGWFVKNDYAFKGDADCLVLADQAAFDALLGAGKTMSNKVDAPNFEQQTVCAIALKPVKTQTDILISKAELTGGNTINIFAETKAGEAISYTMTPALVFQFAKTAGVSTVNFHINGQLAGTVAI